jgi:hypothetical protein
MIPQITKVNTTLAKSSILDRNAMLALLLSWMGNCRSMLKTSRVARLNRASAERAKLHTRSKATPQVYGSQVSGCVSAADFSNSSLTTRFRAV